MPKTSGQALLVGLPVGGARRARCCWRVAQFGGLNSLDMPGTAGHGAGSYTDHRRTARCGHVAAELAGDGRRRHGRQRVRHRRRAASRRHVLRRGQTVAGPQRQPAGQCHRQGGTDLTAGLTAHRVGRARRGTRRRKTRRGLHHPAGPDGALPDHRRSAVIAGRGGKQGQSRCAARHHRRDVQRGRRSRRHLRRLDPAARRADRFPGSADRRHHRRGRRAEPVRRASWRAARTAWAVPWPPCPPR